MTRRSYNRNSDPFGLDGFLNNLAELVDRLDKEGTIKTEGTINFDNLRKGMQGEYGFSFRTAKDSSTSTNTAQSQNSKNESPVVDDEREPLTDVFDEEQEIVVIVEVPGAEEEDISTDLKEDILTVQAKTKFTTYYKEILLPSKTSTGDYTTKYNNGIFEARVKK